jgi:hypothetical protein
VGNSSFLSEEMYGVIAMKYFRTSILVLIFFCTTAPAAAGDEPLSPSQIITLADRARGNLDGVTWTADIKTLEEGKTRQRSLLIKNRGHNTVAEFIAPAKVKGNLMVMLDRNMWFVKPGLRKPVSISSRQKLMGGVANGDIASTNYAADYDASPAGEELVDGETCYVFDLRANNKLTTYDRIRYWISKERLLGIRAEFYTVTGKRFKTATLRYDNSVRTRTGDRPFISRMTIHDEVIKGNVSIMDYRDPKLQSLADAVFNLNLMIH